MSCLFQSLAQLRAQIREDEKLRRDVMVVALVDSLAIGVALLAYSYYRWWSRHPLYGQNKGPKIYPIVGSVYQFLRNRHRILDYNYDLLSNTASNTFRAVLPGARTFYMTANPIVVEHILKTNFENYPKGAFLNDNLRDLLGDGIFNADDHNWKIQRKVASYEFNTRSLSDFVLESAKREIYDRLLPVLSQAAQSGQVLDLQDIFGRLFFDNICQLAFGVDPECLGISLPDVKFAAAFDEATLLSLEGVQAFPRFIWKIQRALNIGRPKKLLLAVGVIDKFAMEVIKNRREELALASARGDKDVLGGKGDLLSRFMTLVDDDSQAEIRALSPDERRKWTEDRKSRSCNNFSDIFLRDIIISFVLAGRDSSTSALSWFFWLLCVHPNVELAILEEISRVLSSRIPPPEGGGEGDQNINNGKSTSSGFSFQELKTMHYLHAALSESMRLYPPVPVDGKSGRKADVWPDGTVIVANSVVGYHPYAMGRLENLWGKDCLEFKPERWLNDGVFVPQSPYKYPIFQAGPRICLGKDMVMLQMKLICAAILSNFELSVAKGYQARSMLTLTLRLKDGLPVTVQKRTSIPRKI